MNVKTFFFLLSLLVTTVCKSQTDTTSYWNKVLSGPNITLLYDTSGVIILDGTLMSLDTPVVNPVVEEKLLFKIIVKGLVIYYSDSDNKKVEAEEGTMYVEVYPSSTKIFGIIIEEVYPEGLIIEGARYYRSIEITKEQIIKFIPK